MHHHATRQVIMDIDRWEQIKENIKQKFEVLEETTEDLAAHTQDGDVIAGKAQVLIVASPVGKIKLSFESKPLVLDKKMIYSHRAGQAAHTEYEFSDTEFTHKLRAYKWDDLDEDWKEINADQLF